MKLNECLKTLPSEMLLIDLVEIDRSKKIKKVSEILTDLSEQHANEDGFEVRDYTINYGRVTKKSIGIISGPSLYNQV